MSYELALAKASNMVVIRQPEISKTTATQNSPQLAVTFSFNDETKWLNALKDLKAEATEKHALLLCGSKCECVP